MCCLGFKDSMLIFTCDMIKDVIKSTCTSYQYWYYLFYEKKVYLVLILTEFGVEGLHMFASHEINISEEPTLCQPLWQKLADQNR